MLCGKKKMTTACPLPDCDFLRAIFLGDADRLDFQGRAIHRAFSIKKLSLPHLKIDERPKSLGMVLAAFLMAIDKISHEARIENATAKRSLTQNILIDN